MRTEVRRNHKTGSFPLAKKSRSCQQTNQLGDHRLNQLKAKAKIRYFFSLSSKLRFKSALAIRIEIGDRNEEALSYENLGTVFYSLCEYSEAKEYLEKAFTITIEICDWIGEASSYGDVGTECVKAQEYQEKSLAIRIEIGDRRGKALSYTNLGCF